MGILVKWPLRVDGRGIFFMVLPTHGSWTVNYDHAAEILLRSCV